MEHGRHRGAGTSLVLQNGQTIDINGDLIFDGNTFVIPGGSPIERNAVSEVDVGVTGAAGATQWTYDRARYEKLFAKGRELAAAGRTATASFLKTSAFSASKPAAQTATPIASPDWC